MLDKQHAKQPATNVPDANGDLVGNKMPDKITLYSKKIATK